MRWYSIPRNRGLWHRWFAWHPVKIGLQWVWLETVKRREVMVPPGESEWRYENL